MATNPISRTPSTVYFSLSRRASGACARKISSSAIWEQSPSNDITFQSPSSDESLTVSPISPYNLPCSKAEYSLPTQQDIERKADLSSFHNNSFEDWMGWDNSVDSTLYSPVKLEYVHLKLEDTSPIMDTMTISGGMGVPDMSVMMGDGLDDGSLAFQDSMAEEPLFQEPQDVQVLQNSNLRTNQQQWSQPQPHQQAHRSVNVYPSLNESKTSNTASLNLPETSTERSCTPSQRTDKRRKRKSTSSATFSSSSAPSKLLSGRPLAPVKKTAHNMIEKRYRTNLNDKIAALRDSVPSLRLTEKKDLIGDTVMKEESSSVEAAQKLNKATILSKATEYIAHLEKRNTYLSKECQSLKDRVDAFEVLLMSRSGPGIQEQASAPQTHSKVRWKQQRTSAATSTIR